MADDKSTNVADTEEVDVAETTDADEQSADDKDVDLEDIEVDEGDVEDGDDESEEKSEDEVDDEAEGESEESTEDTEEAQSDEDKQKAFNNEQAQKRIQERKQQEDFQRSQQREYLDDAEDDKDLALRQLQVDAYNNKVDGNTNKLTNGYERAIKDFDVLREASPEIQAEIDQAIDAFQAQYVTVDAYGNPTDVRADLYQHLQRKAESIAKLTGIGARKQQQNKGKEKSKTLTLPNRAPKQPKKDPDMDAFDEEANKP